MKKLIKQTLNPLGLYTPIRSVYFSFSRLCRRIHNAFLPSGIVFFYHRIAKTNNDPHQLCVSPEHFSEQLTYLKTKYNFLPLSEFTRRVEQGSMRKNDAAVTFDDGYADNLTAALPILEEHGIPATVFITADTDAPDKLFYWDSDTPAPDRGRPMNSSELKRLASSPLIEIGSHTNTHPNLTETDTQKQREEIETSKRRLEQITGKPVVGFSYPFGAYNDDLLRLVALAGYRFACAIEQKRVWNGGGSLFRLPRVVMRDWDAATCAKELYKAV